MKRNLRKPDFWRLKPTHIRETFVMSKLLFLAQINPLKRNVAAALVCLGLLLLPPLYAWFNIGANWSPYDLTSNLKVAVTSLDEGAEVEGVKVNVGDEIVDALKANDAIGWQFVSYDEGQAGVNSGEYYAALVIPKEFTETLTGFLYGHTEQARIDYYINEKENAISTKIMGTGMDTVSSEINETFVETVTTVVLDGLKIVDNQYADYKPSFVRMLDTMDLAADNMSLFVKNMDEFEATLEQMEKLTNNAESMLPQASQALKDASDLTLSAQNTLQSSKSTVSDLKRLLEQNILSLNVMADQLQNDAERLASLSAEDSAVAQERLQDMIDTTSQLRDRIGNLTDNLDRFNQMLPRPGVVISDFVSKLDALESALDENIRRLQNIKDDLASGSIAVEEAVSQASDLISSVVNSVNDAWNAYNNGVGTALESTADQVGKTLDDSYSLLQSLSSLIPQVDGVLGSVRSMGPVGSETVERYKKIIQDTQSLLEKETGDLRALSEDEQLQEVLQFIRQDVEKQSTFLSHPVEMETNRLYPVANYGSGMSPFYTTLAIWVGCLLMMAMISPINEKGLEAYPEARLTPMYLSRLWLYQIVSMFQSAIIGLGDLLILHVDCRHPVLFVLLCILIGQIFTIFVFSLVFTFSAIGKAMAIIVLVLQIAASGGTFPIEMTPAFFQLIHPLLPFTYCIGAMREICFGVYWPSLLQDLVMMAILPIVSLAVVVVFGPALRRFVEFFEHSMKKSGLM